MVIDDNELFSTALTTALRAEGLDAQAIALADVRERLHGQAIPSPGLVVLDLDLGRDAEGRYISGADLVQSLHDAGWKVLIVSGSVDEPGVAAAVAAGASGTVPKSQSFDTLLEIVTRVVSGERVMTDEERRIWTERHERYVTEERDLSRRLARLSPREREVLEMLAEGATSVAIAEHFAVSEATLRGYVRSILTTLEVASRIDAVSSFRQLQPRHRSSRPGEHGDRRP